MTRPGGVVILDLDGVLVDSEVISAQVEAELFTQMGATITVDGGLMLDLAIRRCRATRR